MDSLLGYEDSQSNPIVSCLAASGALPESEKDAIVLAHRSMLRRVEFFDSSSDLRIAYRSPLAVQHELNRQHIARLQP